MNIAKFITALIIDFAASATLMAIIYVCTIIYAYESPSGSFPKYISGLAFIGIAVVPVAVVFARLAMAFIRRR
jgi:hypothetical protein